MSNYRNQYSGSGQSSRSSRSRSRSPHRRISRRKTNGFDLRKNLLGPRSPPMLENSRGQPDLRNILRPKSRKYDDNDRILNSPESLPPYRYVHKYHKICIRNRASN